MDIAWILQEVILTMVQLFSFGLAQRETKPSNGLSTGKTVSCVVEATRASVWTFLVDMQRRINHCGCGIATNSQRIKPGPMIQRRTNSTIALMMIVRRHFAWVLKKVRWRRPLC